MSKVYFSCTRKQEREYIQNLLKEKKWFERENFSVFLPENLEKYESENMKEYGRLKKKIHNLEKKWSKVESKYFRIVTRFHHRKLSKRYTAHASIFGPEGKYHRPNTLFIRLRTKHDARRAIETVSHELLHLLLDDFLKQHRLDYSEHEGIIDGLLLQTELKTLFPNYQKQSISKVNQKIVNLIMKEIL